MQQFSVPNAAVSSSRPRLRTALVASADRSFRNRLTETLTGLRWQVREADGGAAAWAAAESQAPEAVIVDSWLPDLELVEFLREFGQSFPQVEMLTTGAAAIRTEQTGPRSPYRQELLYALRRCQDTDSAAWNTAPSMADDFSALSQSALTHPERSLAVNPPGGVSAATLAAGSAPGGGRGEPAVVASMPSPKPISDLLSTLREPVTAGSEAVAGERFGLVSSAVASLAPSCGSSTGLPSVPPSVPPSVSTGGLPSGVPQFPSTASKSSSHGPIRREANRDVSLAARLPELIGNSTSMLEVSRRIRLVAPRMTPVLIEGPTGSGKELVAEGLHRLSNRSRKPFVAINCAAIPEALLEAELFGHTRGAFTGAVQGRVGRIEAAEGGTLFLDEIGEMPLALQSKLLRFVESGVLQKVGDNETVKVDVRIIAATHQPLSEHAQSGTFRADLYYRLAVFLIRTPSLREHIEDLPLLTAHFLERMGREAPIKRIDDSAVARLETHDWPGNVRELEHVLERAAILAGDETTITADEIDFGFSIQ